MKASSMKALLAVSALSLLSVNVYAADKHKGHAPQAGSKAEMSVSAKEAQTGLALRDLWVSHVFWVRNVVLETVAGNTAAATAAENEAVANAKQIAAAIEPFYGKPASEKLFNLLAGHYGAVKQYLIATSKDKQDAALKSMTDNAGEIAVFLSGANPNLPADTVKSLLVGHGGHHVQQINQFRSKQYAEEAKTWEAMKGHMYIISDAITTALAKQFPAKFM